MTTPAAANFYLAEHLWQMEGKPMCIFNPHDKQVETLPVIFGFNNGGSPGWYSAQLIAEDGTWLGGHICSHEGYMRHDLGIIDGSRPDRHKEQFQPHYPDGYRMVFVPFAEVKNCEPLLKAFELNKAKQKMEALRKCAHIHAPSCIDKPLLENKLNKEQPKKENN